MRVAYVCADPGIPVFGSKGASVHVQEVVRELVSRGAAVDLLCARTGGEPPAGLGHDAGVTVHPLPAPPKGDLAARERACMAADGDLRAALQHSGPHDLVYERYSLWSRAGMAHARRHGVPGVLEVNAPLIDEQAEHRGLVHRAEALAVLRAAAADAAAVVAVSEPVAAWVRRTSGRRDVLVVPNGVDTARISPRGAGPGRARERFTVGFVGTLKPWHGVDVLLDAVARLGADVRLLLVGDGPEAAALQRRAGRLGIADRLEMAGAVPPAEVPRHLHRMDVAVAPYPAGATYFSPLKLFEYLAAGLPVVASRTGQVAAVLTDGYDGMLVPPGDPAALAAALDALRADPRRREALGAAARRTAVTRHTWAAAVDRILAAAGAGARGRRPAEVA